MGSYKGSIVVSMIIIVGLFSFNYFEKTSMNKKTEYESSLDGEKIQKFVEEQILKTSEVDSAESSTLLLIDEVNALKEQTLSEYMEIIAITGHNGFRSMSYEDDWCDASADLRKEEYQYAMLQQREFKKRRISNISIAQDAKYNLTSGLDGSRDLTEQSSTNNMYSEMNLEELKWLGTNDDVNALTEILRLERSGKVDSATEFWAAERLLILGSVDVGISYLVSVYLAHAQISNNNDYKQKNFMNALEMVEYGLKRKSTAALRTFLVTALDNSGSPRDGFNFMGEVSSGEMKEVRNRAKQRYEVINDLRSNENYTALSNIDEGRELEDIYNEELYFLYSKYSKRITSPYIPKHWKNDYLSKNACVERKLASQDFFDTRLPSIRKQIEILRAGVTGPNS